MISVVFIVVMITVFAYKVISCEALIVVHVFLTCLGSEIILIIRIVRWMINKLVHDLSLRLSLAFNCVSKANIVSQWTRFNILYHNVF